MNPTQTYALPYVCTHVLPVYVRAQMLIRALPRGKKKILFRSFVPSSICEKGSFPYWRRRRFGDAHESLLSVFFSTISLYSFLPL